MVYGLRHGEGLACQFDTAFTLIYGVMTYDLFANIVTSKDLCDHVPLYKDELFLCMN